MQRVSSCRGCRSRTFRGIPRDEDPGMITITGNRKPGHASGRAEGNSQTFFPSVWLLPTGPDEAIHPI